MASGGCWLFSIALDHTSIARSARPSVAPTPNAEDEQGIKGSRESRESFESLLLSFRIGPY